MTRRRGDVEPALLDDVRSRIPRMSPAWALSREPSSPLPPAVVASALAAPSQGGARGPVLGSGGVLDAVGAVHAHVAGAGPLQPLLDEVGVSDVLVNGPRSVWVDRGDGVRRVEVDLGAERDVRDLAVRLAGLAGRRLDDARPCVDARLPDGVRLHAVLPPVSPHGTLISLRVPRRRAFTVDQLADVGTVPPAWLPVLRAIVTRRLSFLVSGGTGTGKTTVLSTLLGLADPAERIVLVEDAGELTPAHPHVVRLQTRHDNAEGAGAVGLEALVRHALRMRPDRVVVGECRGAEVRELLSALNTGHEGGCGTVHANTAAAVPARLEALGALAGLDRAALAAQAASALDVVVHLTRSQCRRRLRELAVVRTVHGILTTELALVADPHDPAAPGRATAGWAALAERLGLPSRWP